MVCSKCEKKLAKIIVPDKWKDGARNTTEGGGRKVGENKLLNKKVKSNRQNPYGGYKKCRICQSTVHQQGCYYCSHCAYAKAICAMCGIKLHDTKQYRMHAV